MREAQTHLTKKLRERDLGHDLEGAKITLNEYLDRWLETAVKPRVREKTCQDYDGILRRYIRPVLGDRVLVSMRPMESQTPGRALEESIWLPSYGAEAYDGKMPSGVRLAGDPNRDEAVRVI
jgi:Phage integrase, N-terminal SAM-like domain